MFYYAASIAVGVSALYRLGFHTTTRVLLKWWQEPIIEFIFVSAHQISPGPVVRVVDGRKQKTKVIRYLLTYPLTAAIT